MTATMTKRWEDQGLCRHELWREAWFAEDAATTSMAIAVCKRCPVRETCLSVAMARGDVGVWGGRRFVSSGPAFRSRTAPESLLISEMLADGSVWQRTHLILDVMAALPAERRDQIWARWERAADPSPGDPVRRRVEAAVDRMIRRGRVMADGEQVWLR